MTKRYIVTYAQNDTPVHPGFWAALQHYPGELLVVPGTYHNPTSRYEAFAEKEISWAPEVVSKLVTAPRSLCPNLRVYPNIRTQPTAARPLSGLEVFVGKNSAIVGHPKRALATVATTTRWPRILASTGACTVANYSRSKAGAKGEAHHVLGALVVEVLPDGTYFLRQITWDVRTASFTDLEHRYDATGVFEAPRAASLVVGDVHLEKTDPEAIRAAQEQVRVLRPERVFLHDLFDCAARNHHDRDSLRAMWARKLDTVRGEVQRVAEWLSAQASSGMVHANQIIVVRSNHDEALEKWLEGHDPRRDPINTRYWHELWTRVLHAYEATGKWPNALELECRRYGVSKKRVRFLGRNESCVIRGVEHGFHGHSGVNGAKGTSLAYSKLGTKVSKGHSHVPGIVDGCYDAGHSSMRDHGYNNLPSGWAQANIIQYADGKRALLFCINGKWRS